MFLNESFIETKEKVLTPLNVSSFIKMKRVNNAKKISKVSYLLSIELETIQQIPLSSAWPEDKLV